MSLQINLGILWVPSHVGIEGNDYVDMVASSGEKKEWEKKNNNK